MKPKYNHHFIHILMLFLAAMMLWGGCASTSNPQLKSLSAYPFADRMVIGLMEFNNETETEALEVLKNGLGDLLINELLKYKRYRIVERTKINAIMAELKLQHSGIVKESDVIEVGQHLGADALLFVAIDSLKHKEHTNHGGLAYTVSKKTEATLSARLVSVQSNELLLSSIATARTKQRKSVALGFAKSGTISDDKDSVDAVLKVATIELANKIASQAPVLRDINRN